MRQKGFSRRPNIIDVEASGFGAESYPIEVGIVKSTGERYCALLKPSPSWTYWSEGAESVHGIQRELLVCQGQDLKEVCVDLNSFMDGETAYSDGWSHDSRWLDKLFYEAKVVRAFNVSAIENIVSESQLEHWDETKVRVEACMGVNRHRASVDALIIQQTFVESWQRSI